MSDAPDFIPDDQVPNEASATTGAGAFGRMAIPTEKVSTAPDFIPDEQVPSSQNAPDFIPDDKVPKEDAQQSGLALLEGIGRSAIPGAEALASGMRKGASALGVPDEYLHYVAPSSEEIYQRKENNPGTALTGELIGSAALLNQLPQMGSKVVNGMLQSFLLGANDELSNYILGHGNPAGAAAAHIAEDGAIGLLTGGLFGKIEKEAGKGLKYLENQKIGTRLRSAMAGIGRAASLPEEQIVPLSKSSLINDEGKFLDSSFRKGQQIYKTWFEKVPKYVGRIVAPIIGGAVGQTPGAMSAYGIEQLAEHVAPKLSKKLGPAIMKAASTGAIDDVGHIIDHATKLEKGVNKISKGVESVFRSGSDETINNFPLEKQREKLRKFMENGGTDQQIREEAQQQSTENPQYADGGVVNAKPLFNDPIAKYYPEQNVLISAAKGRVSGYLNSVRPVDNPNKLPFDTKHKDHSKDKEYNKALDLANQPLQVLKHIKDGTLLPKHVHAIHQMYPELYNHLSQKLQERMVQGQLKEEKKPSYKTRQSLSLFLGTSLDSTMTPQGIMAAQNVFAQQKAQKAAPQGNTNALKKMGDSMQTAEQSRQQDLNKH